MELLCFGVFILLLLTLVIFGLVVIVNFLLTMHRTMKTISPEHRRFPPGVVWFCLIPGAGIFWAMWMVWALSWSLRSQFEALEEHKAGDFYGLTAGLVWTGSLVVFGGVLWFWPVLFLPACVFVFTVRCVYWVEISEHKARLEKFAATGRINGLSQEELDYGEDINERSPGDDRPV
ncbi:hypothetical protein [Zavarzinella formosa]|uniref:hypothetical protein n=1 Tax=Zavarzinella formosa TaxID=360055 RepID=UPI0002E66E84|nr:hypothetical protein [Zavarzinella formosa]